MQFKHAESAIRPVEVQALPDGRYMVRKNIIQIEKESVNGETITHWGYDEAVASAVEYAAYSAALAVESKREAEIVDEYTLKLIEEDLI